MSITLELEEKNANYQIQIYENTEISVDREKCIQYIEVCNTQIIEMDERSYPKLINPSFYYSCRTSASTFPKFVLMHSNFENNKSKNPTDNNQMREQSQELAGEEN